MQTNKQTNNNDKRVIRSNVHWCHIFTAIMYAAWLSLVKSGQSQSDPFVLARPLSNTR